MRGRGTLASEHREKAKHKNGKGILKFQPELQELSLRGSRAVVLSARSLESDVQLCFLSSVLTQATALEGFSTSLFLILLGRGHTDPCLPGIPRQHEGSASRLFNLFCLWRLWPVGLES